MADALLAAGLVTAAALVKYASSEQVVGARGVRRARRVAELVEPLSESPMETRLRLVLVLGGLPRPVAQHVVLDSSGRFVARLDLAYPQHCVAVEFDGALHWLQRREDDRRRDRLRALGWSVLVFSGEDVSRQPERIVADVTAELRRRVAKRAV